MKIRGDAHKLVQTVAKRCISEHIAAGVRRIERDPQAKENLRKPLISDYIASQMEHIRKEHTLS